MEIRFSKTDKKCYSLDEWIDAGIGSLPDTALLTEQWYSMPIATIGYDSDKDTLLHIKRVSDLLSDAACELLRRSKVHDESKFLPEEKPHFDRLTPLLANTEFGSDKYKQLLSELKPALDSHYSKNTHHPQFYENGIYGMDLFDLLEMFLDWKAAGERTKNGDIQKSIDINAKRFEMSEQLVSIFKNTASKYLI